MKRVVSLKVIRSEVVTENVRDLFIDCNYNASDDVVSALDLSLRNETSELARAVLGKIIENNKIASSEKIPICQDTGMAVLFVEYGKDAYLEGKCLIDAINDGVAEACSEGYLRASIVKDPIFDRKNTGNNTPAVIYTDLVPGDKIKITLGAKGFGSENMSAIKMLSPADGLEGVKNFILSVVEKAGSKPCPPIVVGVGIGGTFDKAAYLSKKATLRPINIRNSDINYAELENDLLNEINSLNIGPAGFGGKTTALAVNIEYFPTHIAALPVAVNLCCHVFRHRTVII